MINDGERQVAPELAGIRRDHVARYMWAARMLGARRKRVIDLACGVGYGAAVMADAGHEVLALDRNAEALEYARAHYARERVRYEPHEIGAAFPAGRYAAAVCFETIEHIADPLPMLRALHKAAPVLLASVPNETVFPHGGRIKFHFRHYTREQFARLLELTGYRVLAWYGQAGPESDVERDIEGRTLIAHAVRARQQERAPVSDQVEPAQSVPDHVAIVALGPSCSLFFEHTRRVGGASAYCDEVWGINAIGDVLRCDRVFHMDDVRIQEARAAARPDSNIAAMVRWLKRHPGPVYTSVVREGYPGLVAFPLEAVLNRKTDATNGGAPYFNNTAAYAIAYAVHIGVKRISCFGLDFTLPNSHHAEKGRACCEFWLGIAAARGIEITVPEGSSLLDACEPDALRLYGYDCVEVGFAEQPDGILKVRMTDRAVIPTADEIEARYDHSRHPSPLMKG